MKNLHTFTSIKSYFYLYSCKNIILSFLIIVLKTELCVIGALSPYLMSLKKATFGKVKEKCNYS